MLVIVGYLIVVLCVFGGFALSGGHLHALFQPIELLQIGGASLGSFVVANNMKVIKASFKAAFGTLKARNYTKKFYVQLLSMLFEMTTKIRKEGVLGLEADIENPKDSALFKKYPLILQEHWLMEFMCDHLRLITTGRVALHDLENIMDVDIETYESEAALPIGAIAKVSDGMPAFGIVSAVMGVVHTMESIGIPPEQLGGLVARALVGTFLGVLIGYGFIAPIAGILETGLLARVKIMHSVKLVLIASTNKLAPTIAVEFARKVLYAEERPTSRELETILQDVKSNNQVKENG